VAVAVAMVMAMAMAMAMAQCRCCLAAQSPPRLVAAQWLKSLIRCN